MPSVRVEDLQRLEERPRDRARKATRRPGSAAPSPADAVHVPPSPPTCRSPSDLERSCLDVNARRFRLATAPFLPHVHATWMSTKPGEGHLSERLARVADVR